jgi:hypothetical protein
MTTPTPDAFDNDHTNDLGLTADDLAGTDEQAICLWCVDGFAPAGTHSVLGAVYTICPNCVATCPCCGGAGLFSADTTCPHCLTDALATVGCTASFCHTCTGVLAVHPTTEALT